MKYIIIAATLLASITASALQGDRADQNPEERMEQRAEYLGIVLDLNETQKSDFRSAQASHSKAIQTIQEQYKPAMDAMREELKAIRLASEGNMEASREEAKAVREKYKSQLEPMHQAMEVEKDALHTSLSNFLNEAQNDKLTALKNFREAHEMNRPACRKPAGPNGGSKGPKQHPDDK